MDILVLDTEGIDALDAECAHDVCIFALSVLMSSMFVYNSTSHLDEAAVQTLSLMTSVADAVGSGGGHSPTLYWILRDFSLQLVDALGNTISHEEYLEQALYTPLSSKCPTRDAIKTVFEKRHLVTMPHPNAHGGACMLDHKANGLSAKFKRSLNVIRGHIAGNPVPFCGSGVPLSGVVYVEYMRSIIAKVNSDGAIPKVQDSWSLLSQMQHMDKEKTERVALLSLADRACPIDVESVVYSWVEDTCREACAKITFMPPVPRAEEVVGRMVVDVFSHCKSLGRIVDKNTIAQTLIDLYLADVWEPSQKQCASDRHRTLEVFFDGLVDINMRAIVCNLMTPLIVKDFIPMLMKQTQEDTENSIIHSNSLALEEATLSISHLRMELDDCIAREGAMHETKCEVGVQYEDAGTQTKVLVDVAIDLSPQKEKVSELEEEISIANDTIRVLNTTVQHHVEKHIAAVAAFETNMESLKQETVSRLVDLRKERDEGISEAKRHLQQKEVLVSECERLRAVTRDAQQKAVGMHSTTLEELRRRDVEGRAASDKQRQEWGDLKAKGETASQELRSVKRRVDELLMEGEDSKRVISSLQRVELGLSREQAQVELLRMQLDTTVKENDSLRRSVADLSNKLAVSEATSKLEECRRSLV